MSVGPNVTSLMIRFGRADNRLLTFRDILVLWAVIENPGAMGFDVARAIGKSDRSAVQSNIDRLIRENLIEDRRIEKKRTVPNRLYATDQGRAFFAEMTTS